MKAKFNINLFSRDDFYRKALIKSGSYNSEKNAICAVKKLDAFCADCFGEDADIILKGIKQTTREDPDTTAPMVFLDKFSSYLQQTLMPQTIKGYALQIKKYMRLVHGIRISSEDMDDYVTLPMIEEEEKEPLTHEEIRKILDFTRIPRRKALYMLLKDTGCRIGEALRLQRKHIDMNANPVTVFFPKNIVKGKKRARTAFVTNETRKTLEIALEDYESDDYVFGTPTQKDYGYRSEQSAFDWVRRFTKMKDKYESNRRFKKNLHSFRSFCYTQSKLATGDADYAHGYVGHDRYLVVYERMEENEKIRLFNRCAPRLSIFENIMTVSDDDLRKEVAELKAKLTEALAFADFTGRRVTFENLPNIEN